MARGFRLEMDNGVPSRDNSRGNAIDALVSAAGGAPLPGVFGLAQAVAEAWTAPASGPKWLRYGKSTLMSAGAVLAYHRSKQPPVSADRKDKVAEYLTAQRLVKLSNLVEVGGMVFGYLDDQFVYTDKRIDGEDVIFRCFSCGIVAMFWSESMLKSAKTDGWGPAGLYTLAGREDAAVETVRNAIWRGVGGDIDFSSAVVGTYGEVMYSLGRLAPPDDYVDRPENGERAVLAQLADRCQRFTAKGLRRRLMFYGGPGTGKSTLARHLAASVGNGRALRLDPEAVTRASNARLMGMISLLQPAVVLFDDLDRAEGVDGLLSLIEDGAAASVIIATVNAVDRLDPALLRPGRFDEVIEVPSPSESWLRSIALHYVKSFGIEGLDIDRLMSLTPGFTPAELRELLQVVSIVGLDVLDIEAERLGRQRELYGGDAVSKFLARRDKS